MMKKGPVGVVGGKVRYLDTPADRRTPMLCILALATWGGPMLEHIHCRVATVVQLVTERARTKVRNASEAAVAVTAAGGVAESVEAMHRR